MSAVYYVRIFVAYFLSSGPLPLRFAPDPGPIRSLHLHRSPAIPRCLEYMRVSSANSGTTVNCLCCHIIRRNHAPN